MFRQIFNVAATALSNYLQIVAEGFVLERNAIFGTFWVPYPVSPYQNFKMLTVEEREILKTKRNKKLQLYFTTKLLVKNISVLF